MAVVVTGAAGFIGRALVRELVGRGRSVVAIDRRWPPVQRSVVPLRADLSIPDPRVTSVLEGAEAVFHLAGCAGVRDRSPGIGGRRYRDNVLATERIASETPYDTPLVVTSSSSVYGGTRLGRASREDDPIHPIGGYARSKATAEAACRRRSAAGGRVAIARPFTVVGEGQRADMALARWVAAIRAGEPVRAFGSLERTRDFTDIREVVRGLLALADVVAADWPGRGADCVVNVGSGRPRSLQELIDTIAVVLDRRPIVHVEPAAADEVPATCADPTRFASLTGFVPETDLPDVVRRVVEQGSGLLEAV